MIRPRITTRPSRLTRVTQPRDRASIAFVIGLVALSLAAAVPALADESGEVKATINVSPPATASVTVSPATLAYADCTDSQGNSTMTQLAQPNGRCTGNAPITIDNGATPAQIEVAGSDATPTQTNGGTDPWTLCGGSGGALCSNTTLPGADQFEEETRQKSQAVNGGTENPGVVLTDSNQCDSAFDEPSSSGCLAAATQEQTEEELTLVGPKESTDTSTTFTTAITWTAVAIG